MSWVILDTSIYIDHWENGLYKVFLEDLKKTARLPK